MLTDRNRPRGIRLARRLAAVLVAYWLMGSAFIISHMPPPSPEGAPAGTVYADSLPKLYPGSYVDLLSMRLKEQAALAFQLHTLPPTKAGWQAYRPVLKAEIMRHTGAIADHSLPLDCHITGTEQMNGYRIENIFFQTRPGTYATASLYIPNGKGPFPAVIDMHGHWKYGRRSDVFQAVAATLALHGYVCLNIDAWGSGERTTVDGVDEYHGSNLGASLMDVGQTLMGMQITDNMRGVDLLCSLPYVDTTKIGATGASGGGNQTMWLSALDDRIKACVPVVNVGTFEAYMLNSNCVCELLPGGMTFTEESGVLGLIAPRALKIFSALQDHNASFMPDQMFRSYENVKKIFDLVDAPGKLSYQIFDTPHGYWPEMRDAMVGWFDLQLRGRGMGSPVKEIPFELLPPEKLLTFKVGHRDPRVTTTAAFCKREGKALRAGMLKETSFDKVAKRSQLRTILGLKNRESVRRVDSLEDKGGWKRFLLEIDDDEPLPLLYRAPRGGATRYVVLCHPGGKDSIPRKVIQHYLGKGLGVAIPDLWGTGEAISLSARATDGSLPRFHTLARSALWLGKTILGQWVGDLDVVTEFMRSRYGASLAGIDGYREAGLAGLFFATLGAPVDKVILRDAPVSYLFDNRQGVDYFTMATHLPGFLRWGDVSLAAALSGEDVEFIDPVSMSGRKIAGPELAGYVQEFARLREVSREPGHTSFR